MTQPAYQQSVYHCLINSAMP